MNVLLTGATGFVGRRISDVLINKISVYLTCVVRQPPSKALGHELKIKSLGSDVDWVDVLVGQDVIIHAAGRAHILRDKVCDPLAEYQEINVEGTLNLARQAVQAGVRRFIFVSSIGVNGCVSRKPYTELDDPEPSDFYSQSKWEAEQGLWEIAKFTGMEIVILRPPLVYGPNAPGNFGSLVKFIDRGVPLPLGAINNRRSLVALDNLVDLIITCVGHPAAANQVFLAGDGVDLSTTELLRGVGQAIGKPARLIPVPAGMLMLGASLLGKKWVAQRVLGSLQVDISKARNLLGWEPPLSVEEGLHRCFDLESTS
ncbi:MAG: UDP-glucose 4-epimerase family protein [Pseudomonadota bacterium]